MTFLISAITFIIVFTIVALLHEGGHYFAAKRAGIRVFDFGIGFGPKLFSVKKGETTFSVNLIPILAYVKVAGMGEGADEEEAACPEDKKFYNKRPWDKFLVCFSGAFMNILSAFVVLTLIFLFVGVPKETSNEIETIVKGSAAESAGLQPGDRLTAINGQQMAMNDAIEKIHNSPDQELTLTIERAGKSLKVKATPRYDDKLKVALVGFTPKPLYVKVNPLTALYYGVQQTISMVLLMFIILWKLITGAISVRNLAGPVGIAQITGKYAQSGFVNFLHFFAFLSVNIGVINLLPLPALDGGRIVFVIIEKLRGKPVKQEAENKIHQWGLVVFLGLLVLVTLNDVLRIFGK
ncbi:MAG: RIP metalloprotease RseP [Candidatus Margulisbacteria bacterium]|nr:RIP metalloprotease RseP [Candidatus Margulisiibacteriota bacterium]